MTDKQRLLATGLFSERGAHLILEEDSTLACEIVVRVTTQLRFDSSGNLIDVRAWATMTGSIS